MAQDTKSKQGDTKIKDIPCTASNCDRTFGSLQARGVHLSRSHGVKGPKGKGKRKKATNRKKEATPKEAPRPWEQERVAIASEGEFGITGILQTVFPDGIPPHKIPTVVKWVELTKELQR